MISLGSLSLQTLDHSLLQEESRYTSGKVTDEWFMQLSHKYEVERMELKDKIRTTREALDNLSSIQRGQE